MSTAKRKTPAETMAGEVRAARVRKKAEKAAAVIAADGLSFRAFLSDPVYFPTPIEMSPALWAIVDASDGRPDLVPPDLARQLFNCEVTALPRSPARVVGVAAGRRGGKTSRLLAPKALHLAWTVPLPNLRPGEIARLAVVAQDLDAAGGLLSYVRGLIAGSEVLRSSVVQDAVPEDAEDVGTAGGVVLRRPDGTLVDIVVRASSRGGKAVRSRSLVGLVLDEAAFLTGEDGRTANDVAIFDAASPAVEPGGQIWIASTPWVEGQGLLEQLILDNWTRGTQGHTALVAARVGTRLLRPGWDPDGSIERSLRAGADGDLVADREINAIPLQAGSRSFFLAADVDAAMLLTAPDLAPLELGAGADYAHVSDRSALAVTGRYPGGFFGASLVIEVPSSPDRKPSQTYGEFAVAAKLRGTRDIASDGHYREAAREEYERHGMSFKLAGPTDQMLEAARAIMRERRLALGDLPESDRDLLKRQMASVVVVPGQNGKSKILLPRSTVKDAAAGKGTTHCDALVALCTALYRVGSGNPELWAHEEERRASSDAARAAMAQHVPRPGSLASLNAYRSGGRAISAKPW